MPLAANWKHEPRAIVMSCMAQAHRVPNLVNKYCLIHALLRDDEVVRVRSRDSGSCGIIEWRPGTKSALGLQDICRIRRKSNASMDSIE